MSESEEEEEPSSLDGVAVESPSSSSSSLDGGFVAAAATAAAALTARAWRLFFSTEFRIVERKERRTEGGGCVSEQRSRATAREVFVAEKKGKKHANVEKMHSTSRHPSGNSYARRQFYS